MEQTRKYVSVAVAMQELETSDADATRRLAKKHDCHRKAGPIERIDIETLKTRIDAEFDLKAAASTAATKSPRVGSKLGLVRARLAQYEKRFAAKRTKIAAASKALAAAADRYSKIKFEAEVAKLRGELEQLEAGKVRDENLLDEILNSGADESAVDESA